MPRDRVLASECEYCASAKRDLQQRNKKGGGQPRWHQATAEQPTGNVLFVILACLIAHSRIMYSAIF